uniref:Uncharacterized protein n=1 Tax=Aplanochytrium stocchinoi TaxID=215587 RepID=A0A7S3V0A0_9STRA
MAYVMTATPVDPAGMEAGKPQDVGDDVPKAIDLFSILLCLNTISDVGVIFILADQDFQTSYLFIIVGLIVAGTLRGLAAYQYYHKAGILSAIVNFALGGRFGLKSRNPQTMDSLPFSQQLSDPYILHIISDDIQHGFSGYACFLALSIVPDNDHPLLIASTLLTGVCILARLAEREPYGTMLQMANIFLWYSTLFFIFIILATWTEELIEDKIYTKDFTYGWIRFLTMLGAGGIDLALYQRRPVDSRSKIPMLMTVAAFAFLIADIAAIIVFKSDVTVFFDNELVLLKGLIYTNIVVDGLMVVHGFIACRS